MKLDLGLKITDSGSVSDWVKQSREKEKETKKNDSKRQAELLLQRQNEEEEEFLTQLQSRL